MKCGVANNKMAASLSRHIKFKCISLVRGLTLSTPNLKDQLAKRARVIEKLLNRGKKKKYFATPMTSSPFGGPVGNMRRATVLSNLFMENITDVMSTEECGSHLRGYGIEITFVRVTADCKMVNVYWTIPSSNYDQAETVSKLLKSCAGEIRSKMTRQQVLGIVPYINFVQDKAAKNAAEVERLLSIADFGPDYIPVNSGHIFHDNVANVKASAKEESNRIQNTATLEKKEHDQESITSLNDGEQQQHENCGDIINNCPPMKMNVFKLDYNSIMNQVIHKMKKPYKLEEAEMDVSEFNQKNQRRIQNNSFNDTAEKNSINLANFLKERKKYAQMKNKTMETMLQENKTEEEDSEDILENSKFLEEEDYYDESEIDGNRHHIPQNDELHYK